jgi:hypothetical protein
MRRRRRTTWTRSSRMSSRRTMKTRSSTTNSTTNSTTRSSSLRVGGAHWASVPIPMMRSRIIGQLKRERERKSIDDGLEELDDDELEEGSGVHLDDPGGEG